jgi:hypothetical protein
MTAVFTRRNQTQWEFKIDNEPFENSIVTINESDESKSAVGLAIGTINVSWK